ncbi:MAG: hypothetical protein K0U78_02720 [Actinomycetia bacterium]|nr:hypothetical protein [Actinomycetes bacterium]
MNTATSRFVDPSPAGVVYQSMLSELLTAELDRRKTLEARGATLVAASAALVTLIFGLTVIVTGKDHVFVNRHAVLALLAAMALFVISAMIAITVQTYGFKYTVVEPKYLKTLAGTREAWTQTADFAVRIDVGQKAKTIGSLRTGNATMANLITWSLRLQLVAIALLSVSVGLEIYARLSIQSAA